MAQPNSSFDELASITIANYSEDLRDNVSNSIPTWYFFDEAGAIVEEDGGNYLLENLDFADIVTFTWYSGNQEISTSPTEAFTSANFDWKEGGCNIVFNAGEVAKNSGRSKKHDLIKGKTRNAERTMGNNVGAALYYVGTESDGKAFGGAQYIIADDPTTGVVGGINRATAGNEFWRNQVFDESVGADNLTLSASTILDAMELLFVRCTRGSDTPNLWVYGNTYWRYFAGAVNTNSRYIRESDAETAKTSFPYYMFKNGIKVFHDPNAGATRGYAINTEYTKLKVHRDRNMTPDKPRYPSNQRATVIPIDMMANLTCGNCSLNGVMQP